MKRSIGLVESKRISRGILIADTMLKAANVELIMARTLCPGRYIVLVAGDVGAVQSAVVSGETAGGANVMNAKVLANIHPAVLSALTGGTAGTKTVRSLGIIESSSVTAAIIAADAAAKAAAVDLLRIRLAQGLGGKALVLLSGEVSAATAAVQVGSNAIKDSGFLLDSLVISAPHEELQKTLLK